MVSGYRDLDDEDGGVASVVCAAVQAEDEQAAMALIRSSYDNPPEFIEWRFVEERPDDWTPFNDRFQRADWMKWDG